MNENSKSAWYVAVERYVATLPPEHRNAFHEPANAEDCLLLIEKAQARNRKFDKLASTLKPLIIPLKRFESSIDILVQTQSLFLSPVWAPLRCVLTIVGDRLAALASVTTLLGRLVEPLRRFMHYETLFANNLSLRTAIGALYCDLIEFCSRVVAHNNKSVLRKNFGSFDRDVQEMSLKIRHHWNEVDIVANAANLAEAKAAREAEELARAEQNQLEVNRWLAPANVDDDLRSLRASYQPGSCDWILESPEFINLQEATGFHALRITGHPGGGKSTAAAFLADHLISANQSEQPERAVLYFFCKASDTEKTFAHTILRTLIFQLLQVCPTLNHVVRKAFHRSGRLILDTETETFAVFESLLSEISNITVHIILDAVDECRDAPTLLQALLEIPRSAELPLKVIILGREDPALKILLRSCEGTLALHSHQEPLEQYIAHRVSNLSMIAHLDEVLGKRVISEVVQTSEGLWLFAKMLLDEIERAPSPEEITRQLQCIPHGLIELYTSILRAREAAFTAVQMKMVQQLYLWLDKSDYIPARFWKGTIGDSLEDDMIACIFKYACQSSQIFSPMKHVQDMCTPLVHTRVVHPSFMIHHHDGYDDDATVYVAEFFHQTAKQYLNWSINAIPRQVPVSLKLRRLGHLHRGVFATWYFTESADFQRDMRQLRERPREAGFECMMNVSCALWRALNVAATASNLVIGHEEEAEELCDQLTWFITTDRCLDFIEATFILNFTTQFDSTMAAIFSLLSHIPKKGPVDPPPYSKAALPPALRKLEAAQAILMADLAWIICTLRLSLHSVSKKVEMPVGFEDRQLAQSIMGIARKWEWLSWSPKAVSSNSFLLSPKR